MTTMKMKKIRKYLFLISVMSLFVSFFHLLYMYLYEDAEIIPIKWGVISEWLIWSFPSLNPIKNLSWNNQYIINLLYRSLLKYDLEQWKIVWDITNCDISNLVSIECYLNENAKWSNGNNITTEDIYLTYDLIKKSKTNIILTSLLEWTTIEYTDTIIKFKNSSSDVNFLNIFFQPILAKEVIESLSWEDIAGNFPTSNWVYSWDFKVSSVSSDLTLNVSKIILDKNDFYNTSNISRVILNIFPSNNSFQKSGQLMNIFNDTENIIWNTIPRLQSYKYTIPQFVWLFINQNKVTDTSLRTFIFNKINVSNLIELLWKDDFSLVENPYLNDVSIATEPTQKNFESIMYSLWYFKKSRLIGNLVWNSDDTEKIEDTSKVDIDPENISIDDFQQDSELITSPKYVEKYNFVTKDDILLEWKVSDWVEEVWVNDYKLTWFSKWDNVFYYRLRTSYDSIKEWRNNYKIYFVKNWKKEIQEEIEFLYFKNENTLNEEKDKLVKELYNALVSEKEEANKAKEIEKNEVVDQKELDKLNKLDENTYYDKDLVPFSLTLYYPNSDKDIEDTANFIKSSLKELWMDIKLVPFVLDDLAWILSNKNEYDMILTWVTLWYFDFNIFPYFHSSQSKSGYNFSNVKKTSLDLILEELKSNILNEEKVIDLENKALDILKQEQVIKTLYTPKSNLLVDKNLKIEKVYEKLPAKYLRSYILNSSYTKDEKVINYSNKTSIWFLKFIFKKLYE